MKAHNGFGDTAAKYDVSEKILHRSWLSQHSLFSPQQIIFFVRVEKVLMHRCDGANGKVRHVNVWILGAKR